MLLRQHRGRRDHRHLIPGIDRFERGAHRHFGFAVTHIAAQKPVHRLARIQIGIDLFNTAQLVGSFGKFKTRCKFPDRQFIIGHGQTR